MSRTEVKPIDVFRTMQAAEPGARLVSLIPHDQYASIPADLDEDIRPLLTLGAGLRFTRSHGMEVRWDGGLSSISADDAFPRSMCLAENGFGDGWNVDINPTTGRWGPVYFVGHDPPVIVLQAGHFVDFLLQLAGEGPEPPSSLSRVLGGVFDIATSGGAAVPLSRLSATTDPLLQRVLAEYPANSSVADLRAARLGDGFRWNLLGLGTNVRRPCPEQVFVLLETSDTPAT